MNSDETATVRIVEMHFAVSTGFVDLIDLKAGRAQRDDGVSQWRAH
jgi:hypothetical protein